MHELAGDQPPLRRVTDVFALSTTELGRLFGVSRQAAASRVASAARTSSG